MNLGKSSKYLYQINWLKRQIFHQVFEQNSDVQRLRPKCVASDDFLSVLIGKHRRKIYIGKSAVCLKWLNTVYIFVLFCAVSSKTTFFASSYVPINCVYFILSFHEGKTSIVEIGTSNVLLLKKRLLFFSFLTCSLDST